MDELKPCPFCGGKAMQTPVEWGDDDQKVICVSCGCGTQWYAEPDRSVKAWNTRALLARIRGEKG